MKKWPYTIVKRVVCLGEDNVVIFYYLIASEIWPNKKGWEGDYCYSRSAKLFTYLLFLVMLAIVNVMLVFIRIQFPLFEYHSCGSYKLSFNSDFEPFTIQHISRMW